MAYIYHGCPVEMKGDTLYPLNALQHLYPDIFERETAKYQDHPDRVKLPQLFIPKLNSLWSDVVFCFPIHPHLLYHELIKRGVAVYPYRSFFQIPVASLRNTPTVVFYDRESIMNTIPDDSVEWFDAKTYKELESVPLETLLWYDKLARQGRTGATFVGIPHILVKGPIFVGQSQVIHWQDKRRYP